jgi:hypothetical protein
MCDMYVVSAKVVFDFIVSATNVTDASIQGLVTNVGFSDTLVTESLGLVESERLLSSLKTRPP